MTILDRLVEQTPIEWKNVSPHLTPEGNCILVRTKLVLGEFFPFLDLQDCLASLRLADNCPVDLGKWKVLPRQVLFLLESVPSRLRREEYIFFQVTNKMSRLLWYHYTIARWQHLNFCKGFHAMKFHTSYLEYTQVLT